MKHWYVLSLILLYIGCCTLYLLGITWGLPSSYIENYYHGNISVSQQYVKQSWQISKEKSEEKLPRSVFNSIRSFHPDEQNILKSISAMSPEKLDFNPHFFEYPSCQIYLVAITLEIFSIMKFVNLTTDISYYFNHREEMGKIYLAGRLLTVTMAVCGLIFFTMVAVFLYGKWGGLFATACLGLSPLYVINSHYMTVDIPMVFWIIVSLFFIVKFIRTKKFLFLCLSSFFIGVASGTKYPAVTMIFALPFVYFADRRNFNFRFFKDTMILFFLLLVGFLITTPYALISFQEFKRDVMYQTFSRGVGASDFLSYFRFPGECFGALWVGVWLILILYIAGICVQAVRRNFSDRIVLTCCMLMFLPLLSAGGFKYARYYLIVLPFLSLSAGCFFDWILQIRNLRSRLLGAMMCMIFLVGSFSKSLAYSVLMSKKDVRLIAAEYIEREIKPASTIIYTKDPWIFEVPPVSPLKYSVSIIPEHSLQNAEPGSFLILGELQYFLTSGDRMQEMNKKIWQMKKKGFIVKKIFANPARIGPFEFDFRWTLHDMLYAHPLIFLFYKP
ncbi:MAG TPA: glycosyltransferase family 39 protein [bacterium]|nr:glycosyltransferase family 39 protein [bacterium]